MPKANTFLPPEIIVHKKDHIPQNINSGPGFGQTTNVEGLYHLMGY
jgi:hypothetical protein